MYLDSSLSSVQDFTLFDELKCIFYANKGVFEPAFLKMLFP